MRIGKKGKPYTTGEVAALCHVTINAVKKWIASGKLGAYRTPGGHWRIDKSNFEEFITRYRLQIKDELFPDRKSRVLIVDDEPGVVEYIIEALGTRDDGVSYEIVTAGDGYDALIKVGYFNPDLLILDIRMPRIDGYEVCRRLRDDDKTKSIKILAVTAFGKEDMVKVLDCGADRCLAKPLSVTDLQSEVESLLAGR